jgi:hypothetical protein
MRNSAIGCACLLAVFEGVGITMQRMFAQGPAVSTPPRLKQKIEFLINHF